MKPDHSTTLQLFFFAATMIGLWHSELFFSGESLKEKWKHTALNFHFLVTATLVQLPLTIVVIKVSEWAADRDWGILYKIPLTDYFLVKLVVGFLMMDFFEYLYHFTMHKLAFLWNFHLIHHSDNKLDVSTTVREHPLETFIRVSFMVLTVFLTGMPMLILFMRQFVQSFFNVAAHSSLSLPQKWERRLGTIFITPGLHKVHHHDRMPYTDSNFGDIFCIWDRLFGTYMELEESKINFGIDTVQPLQIETFSQLMAHPFLKKEKIANEHREIELLTQESSC